MSATAAQGEEADLEIKTVWPHGSLQLRAQGDGRDTIIFVPTSQKSAPLALALSDVMRCVARRASVLETARFACRGSEARVAATSQSGAHAHPFHHRVTR